jgi:hypothetical protein
MTSSASSWRKLLLRTTPRRRRGSGCTKPVSIVVNIFFKPEDFCTSNVSSLARLTSTEHAVVRRLAKSIVKMGVASGSGSSMRTRPPSGFSAVYSKVMYAKSLISRTVLEVILNASFSGSLLKTFLQKSARTFFLILFTDWTLMDGRSQNLKSAMAFLTFAVHAYPFAYPCSCFLLMIASPSCSDCVVV